MIYTLDGQLPRLDEAVWVADSAVVVGNVVLESAASVWFHCVIRGDSERITVGAGANIQDASVLHTDPGLPLMVGAGCSIGHQVTLHGCSIGENSLVGIQSVILNRAVIGKNSMVGAGSLVPEGKVFPDGVLLLGRPAKVVRELTPIEIQSLTLTARHYQQNAQRFAKGLQVHSSAD